MRWNAQNWYFDILTIHSTLKHTSCMLWFIFSFHHSLFFFFFQCANLRTTNSSISFLFPRRVRDPQFATNSIRKQSVSFPQLLFACRVQAVYILYWFNEIYAPPQTRHDSYRLIKCITLLRGGLKGCSHRDCSGVDLVPLLVQNGSIPTKELSSENLGLRLAQKWMMKISVVEYKREGKELDIISTQLRLRPMTSLQSEITKTNNRSHVSTTCFKFY
jgi:hypothetical protein